MRSSRTTAFLLLVSLVGSATACGGDDDGGDALTKGEYIDAANDVCQDNLDDTGELDQPEQGDVEGLARYLDDARAIFEATRDRFEALDPPADADEVNEGQIAQMDEAIDALSEARGIAEEGDFQGAAATLAGIDIDEAADQLAADYGLTVCSTQEPNE